MGVEVCVSVCVHVWCVCIRVGLCGWEGVRCVVVSVSGVCGCGSGCMCGCGCGWV